MKRSLHFYWYKCDFSRDLVWQEFNFATWMAIKYLSYAELSLYYSSSLISAMTWIFLYFYSN